MDCYQENYLLFQIEKKWVSRIFPKKRHRHRRYLGILQANVWGPVLHIFENFTTHSLSSCALLLWTRNAVMRETLWILEVSGCNWGRQRSLEVAAYCCRWQCPHLKLTCKGSSRRESSSCLQLKRYTLVQKIRLRASSVLGLQWW
jgi:hypothetical protein